MANQRDQAAWKEVETMMRKETQTVDLLTYQTQYFELHHTFC